MDPEFLKKLFHTHKSCPSCPTPSEVSNFFTDLLTTLFADFSKLTFQTEGEFQKHIEGLQSELERILRYSPQRNETESSAIAGKFFASLSELYTAINQDVDAMFEGDPAAKSGRCKKG